MKIHSTLVDHVVLTVSDIDASRRWWAEVTGAHATKDHEGEVSLAVGGQAIRLRQGTPAPRGTVGICLVADASIHDIFARAESLDTQHGDAHPRTGATAPMQAVTLEDPDGYQVDLATYQPEARTR